MLAEDTVTVYTPFQQVKEFCKFAEMYKSDFYRDDMKKFMMMDLDKMYKYVLSKYTTEEGEQILRPWYYNKIGGDCDDATIWYIALFLACGISKNLIYIVEAKKNESDDSYCHIFCALYDPKNKNMIWIDNLSGTTYGNLKYPQSRIKITPLTDYI
jgi:hypothetical protein